MGFAGSINQAMDRARGFVRQSTPIAGCVGSDEPFWNINDPDKDWSEPSLDFLLVDSCSRLTVIELKQKVLGVKPAWLALCQVTHRAASVQATINGGDSPTALLEKAHQACWSGKHHRVPVNLKRQNLADRFKETFGLPLSEKALNREIRRCVAAVEFGQSWDEVRDEFNRLTTKQLRKRAAKELESQQSKRELKRIKKLCDEAIYCSKSPVVAMPLTE